ncbi:MAG: T9SS type A sorting domain-containing protein [candidate division Zixibacteria bacterium]|nr:T9SS type A sorting domain-containing protein [candidate division Zixibacteria bacterium]
MSKTILIALAVFICLANVNAQNSPVINPIADTTVSEGTVLEWHITATDADNDSLVLSMSPPDTSPMFVGDAVFVDSGNGAASFIFNIGYAHAGGYDIWFIADDLTDKDSFMVTLTVEDGDVPPVWALANDTSIIEGTTLAITVSATDADGTVPVLTYEVPENAQFVDNLDGTGSFTFSPTFIQAGVYPVLFYATDETDLVDTLALSVTVIEAGNQPPGLTQIPDTSFTERSTLQLIISASDPDSTIPQLSTSLLPDNADFLDNGDNTGLFTFSPDSLQFDTMQIDGTAVFPIWFYASDGEEIDSQEVIITANGPNLPVSFTPIGDKIVTEGELLEFVISATDPNDMLITLTVSPDIENADFADSGNGNGLYRFTPSFLQGGFETVTFFADDGFFVDTESIIITITEAGNQPPVFEDIASPQTVDEDSLLQFTVAASDPEEELVHLSIENLLDNSTFNTETGEFVFTPDLTQGGDYSVTFFASDSVAGESVFLTDTLTVDITVNEIDFPPSLDEIGGKAIDEGTLLRFEVSGHDTDTDGEVVSLSMLARSEDSVDVSLYSFIDRGDGTGFFEFSPDYTMVDTGLSSRLVYFTFYARDTVDVDSEMVVFTVSNIVKDVSDPGEADSLLLSSFYWDGSRSGFAIDARIWNDSAVTAAMTGFKWDKDWLACDSVIVHLPLNPGDYQTTFISDDSSQFLIGFILFDSTFLDYGYHDYFTAYFSYDSAILENLSDEEIDSLWQPTDILTLSKAKVGSTGDFVFDWRLRGSKAQKDEDLNLASFFAPNSFSYVPLAAQGLIRAAFNSVSYSLYDVENNRFKSVGDTLFVDGTNQEYQLRFRIENPKKLSGINLGVLVSSPDGAVWNYAPQIGGLGSITEAITVFDKMSDHESVWDTLYGLNVSETNIDGIDADSLLLSGMATSVEMAGLSAGRGVDVVALSFIPGNVGIGEVKQICFDTVSYGVNPEWGFYRDTLLSTSFSGPICFYVASRGATDTDDDNNLPSVYSLSQNYPNPFNPSTTIQFSVARGEYVSISVYNILGQRVQVLTDKFYDAGAHEVVWDGKDSSGRRAASGIYLYRLESKGLTDSKKMILIK